MFVPCKLSKYPSYSQTFNKYFSSSNLQLRILRSRVGTLPRRKAPHFLRWTLRVVGRDLKEKDPAKLLDWPELPEG